MLGLGLGLRVRVRVRMRVGRRCVGVVVVPLVVVVDCRAKGVLEHLGQDVFHVDRDTTVMDEWNQFGSVDEEKEYWKGCRGRETNARERGICRTIDDDERAAPRRASQSSATNEPHMRIISMGDNALSTMLTSVAFACFVFCNARDSTMCYSAMSRRAMRLRIAALKKWLICSEDMYLALSSNSHPKKITMSFS
jgi:hypothetical protein